MDYKGYNIAVIGAGPAGLTAAYELLKANAKVEIFEASGAVGGMSKTLSLWGQLVDLGPHRFFSSDPRVNRLWFEVMGKEYVTVNRLTRIYYKNIFFKYPLQPFDALKGLGLFEAARCISSYLAAKTAPKNPKETFEEWVVDKFGRRLFNIFFKSYSEKLWGIPCSELNADFAAQRIKKLSLFEAVKDAFIKSKGRHKTLADRFAYPLKGTGMVYEKMTAKIIEMGGKVYLDSPVNGLAISNGGEIRLKLAGGEERSFTHLVSSMPITALINQIGAPEPVMASARKLTFRNTILVYLEVHGIGHFPDQWIYVHSPDLKTGRITNFRNWSPSINGQSENTIICLEYWCNSDDEMWQRDNDSLITLASREALATKLIPAGSILQGFVVKLPNSYPVYARNYRQYLKPVQEYLSRFKNLILIGRYGSFKYNNQDHSILMGLLAAEKILKNPELDLWEVNTDDEYQEEAGYPEQRFKD